MESAPKGIVTRGIALQHTQVERRSGVERRRTTISAFWRGALRPRRRGGRRASDQDYPIVDWHSPRVLALVITIVCLCALDGGLTLLLLSHGATEENPLMAVFLPDRPGWFAAVKLSLTSLGVCVLAACSRMRLFRAIPTELFLYVVAACYLALVAYELKLVELMLS
ncbi:MAG TPA: DUF5658 family protein [Steroidobacter sp.]|jgi:hypothetical protein|nr:DUF5658 family protein [Steroidobacter sp.]